MVEAGVTDPDADPGEHRSHHLDPGRRLVAPRHQRPNHYLSDNEQSGTYTYEDGRFTLYWGPDEVITARVDIARDGSLRFRDLHDNLPELQKPTEGFFGQPWRRVSDLPD